ncbi:MAG: sulfatase-like hydrolase/transferase, partial [Planctomycetaceae bacterium]|nr:sulfatase-like hydrolase/transferase [Planctomycetaceae bacterium]
DNTLVIFSSDNGPARASRSTALELMHDTATGAGYGIGAARGITAGRKGYKSALFEGGIGVPFIARWPGTIDVGKVDKTSMISAVDLLPTFCEIAGVTLPESYKPDGVSQIATLTGKATVGRTKPLFWKMNSAWPIQKSRPHHWVSYAIVDQQWKLVSNKDASYVELYDLGKDPYEKHDLKETHAVIVDRLLEKLEQWKASLPAKPTGDVFSAERSE